MHSYTFRLASFLATIAGGLLLASTALALDTWETVTPSGASGTFRAVVSAGDYVYLATSNAVYRSQNDGASWSTATGLPGTSVNGIAIGWTYDGSAYVVDGTTPVYAATDSGVYESTLGSDAWTATALSGVPVYDVHVDQLMAVSGSPTALYAGTADGVQRSDDAGASWILVNTGIELLTITDLASDFANGVLYARTSGGDIHKSDLYSMSASDETWTQVYDGSTNSANDITLLSAIGASTWLATTNGILKDDGSNVWASTNVGMPNGSVLTVASDYAISDIAYAAHGTQGIYRTTTEALATLPNAQWVSFNANLSPMSFADVATNPIDSSTVFAMRTNALYRMELSDPYVDLTAPSAITDLAATLSDSIVTLTWTQPGDDETYGTPSSYDVRYATSEIQNETDWNNATQLDLEPTPYDDPVDLMDIENLPANTRHYFAVRAVDEAGNMGPLSNSVYAGDNAPASDTTAPSVPAGLSTSNVAQTSITLSWSASTDAVGVTGYRVYRALGSGSLSQVGTVTSGTSFSHTSLSAGTTYSFAVLAYDAAGNESALSSTIQATTAASSGGGSSGGGGGGGGGGSSNRDTSAPRSTSVVINGNAASTAQQSVTLTLSARDESTPIMMQISNTSSFTNVPWVTYSTTYAWTLPAGTGSKTVYARFKDGKGNISASVSDTITLTGAGVATPQAPSVPSQQNAAGGSTGYSFTANLGLGAEGAAVIELQKRLRGEGLFTYPTNTGYYGPATAAAVAAYQRKYGIDPTGFVGPMTREKLNGTKGTSTSSGQNGEMSLATFVRLLIAVGVIPPEKAALALSILEGAE